MAHELTHVRRGDWYFTLLASLNKCIFWFHPLAWWLERRLATLAEQASDEGSVLLTRDPARYASLLLEVSAAVSPSGGRYMAGGIPTVPMASAHPVARRIHRILDSPALSSGVFPARNWVMVVACAIPFLGAIAAARPQDAPRPTRPSSLRTANATAWINDGFKTTAAEAQQLEEQLARQTGDLEVRAKLISYYLYNAMQEPLAKHVLWVIEHQPDSELASSHPVSQPFSYSEDKHFAEKKALWLQQATVHNNNPRILANAATFLQQIDPPTAERLWKRAYQMEPAEPRWQSHLAAFYARVVEADSYFQVGVNVLRLWPESNPSYPAQVVAELERSSDAALIGHVGTNIASRLRGSFYGGGTAFDAFQARRSMADRAESFLRRAQAQDPGNAMWTNGFTVLEAARKQDVDMKMAPPHPTTANELPSAASGDRVRVGGLVQERKLIQGEQPAYPALARQARLQGVVRLDVVIGVDGKPAHLQVRAGHPLLVPAAVEAVRKWRYEPTLLNGRAVEVETVVDVNFTLGQ